MEWLKQVHADEHDVRAPAFRTGDQVRVLYRIQEQDRVRTVPFEGIVIRLRGSGRSKTFTVRRVTFGIGVERVFQLGAPLIVSIQVIRRGAVRRARLYFLRTLIGKTRISFTEKESASAPTKDAPVAANEASSGSDKSTA